MTDYFSHKKTNEELRLAEDANKEKYWKRWGPYVGERQWATVREDYSFNGDAWSDFPFEHSRSRTYRWGEDGLAGVSDNHQLLCITLALWNGQDDILKERAFGVTGPQGNHGEDVKELYFYLDNTPTHSYMKYLYKYPHAKFPYKELVEVNGQRSRLEKEYELTDTGIFEDNEYFDVVFEMAKDDDDPDELYFRITAFNRSSKPAPLHILPHIFYRNTWAWGMPEEEENPKPNLSKVGSNSIGVDHWKFGGRRLIFAPSPMNDTDVEPTFLFTDNETNMKRLYGVANKAEFTKDAFHDRVVDGVEDATNPACEGTKACAWFNFDEISAGDYATIRYKLTTKDEDEIDEEEFDEMFVKREQDADEFYWRVSPLPIPDQMRNVQRQAFAGLLWTKQFYQFIQEYWYRGDPTADVKPAPNRANGRNKDWKHMYINDVLSLPDKWEYPFFAAWDTAFHCIPLAMLDPSFAKKQLELLLREWYMHPNGQIPAYEWNFGDVNPPVHAWAAFRIYKIERKMYGVTDTHFLESVFQKLLLNFTWWVNRKDADGNGVFEGGFLGLDNIGIFNRSEPLPTGGTLEQADSTGWMAFFSLQMLNIALELAKTNHVYEGIASKFFEHFLLISDALTYMNALPDDTESTPQSLWNEKDNFYYDSITWGGDNKQALPVRSLVGLIPLYACLTLEPELLKSFPNFKRRLDWFINTKSHVAKRNIASMKSRGTGDRLLLSLVDEDRLVAILERMLDEDEFLSPYGIRSMSKFHEENPFKMNVHGQDYTVGYLPGESDSGLFGGNSNWRGPIWLPTNFLLVESLQRFFLYYGPSLKVECPKGSGEYLNLAQVAEELQHRLIHLMIPDDMGERACNGGDKLMNHDQFFKDCVPFFEYFDGDTGRGLGASHQCGWTALVAKWIHDTGISCRAPGSARTPRSESLVSLHSKKAFSDYVPVQTPIPGSLTRRKSARGLFTLTADVLEMTDEEIKAAQASGIPGLSRKSSNVGHTQYQQNQAAADGSPKSVASEKDKERMMDFLSQVRNAMSSFQIDDNDEGFVSGDELEAQH
ncbi:unnamed protein product [Kuraishia capsulata CBS 1993]|uniref:Mannosyl-oligosaccharide glucosidase n=1 Tax=Kuraishia capsulata CBS 1993 TaxID=1382522 RepID=W6MUX0_9ASCO|nr:uncharacterized protein KUCA_T00005600001 [Kuraishia capsulata CBS 1993]CDK29607.1 unnamed protein product [Kuraishia capsulata CBS 1993]